MGQSSFFDLSGKVAIITGASRGIGEAMARAYADAGAKVVLASRRQEDLDKVAASIKEGGGEATAIAAHTGDQNAIQQLVEKTVATYGGVDIAVNNAATNPHYGPITTSEESQWQKTLDVNVMGYYRLAKGCIDSMKQRGGGKIINIASIAGLEAQPGMGVYCISKAAVLMMTKVLASELAGDNIQVNAIAPGFVKTKFSSALWKDPKLNEASTATIPQKRIAEPDEIAGIALYLAAPASSFTTGATFVVDGGQVMR